MLREGMKEQMNNFQEGQECVPSTVQEALQDRGTILMKQEEIS